MRYGAKVVGRVKIAKDQRIVLDHARLHGEDYSGRKLTSFCTIGCRLESCRFDGAEVLDTQFGGGREVSEFVDCTFDGARLIRGGGRSRFVRCSFRDVDLREWRCFAVEMVDCAFSGQLRVGIFNGSVREEDRADLGREHNEFRGNDFSSMKLIDVAFRTGIDLTRQRLPTGPEYTYLPDAAAAVERARIGLIGWLPNSELHRVAMTFVGGLAEEVKRGQQQMLLRADDYYPYSSLPREAVDRVFALLR